MRTIALLLLLTAPAYAQPTLFGRVSWDRENTATLALLADGTELEADILPRIGPCPVDGGTLTPTPTPEGFECFSLALAERGTTTEYSVRACNVLAECSDSNVVPFRVPHPPAGPTLGVSVAIP